MTAAYGNWLKVKANTYIAPQTTTVAAAALYVTDRADVQPAHRGLQPYSQTATRGAVVCRLMVFTPVIHVITRITTHLPPRRDERLSWPG